MIKLLKVCVLFVLMGFNLSLMGQETKKILLKDWKENFEIYSLRKRSLEEERNYLKSTFRTYQTLNPNLISDCEQEILELINANYEQIEEYKKLVDSIEAKIEYNDVSENLINMFEELKRNKISALPEFYERVHIKMLKLIESKIEALNKFEENSE